MLGDSFPRLHDHYHVVSFLGQGSDGKVFKAQYIGPAPLGSLNPGTAVAIKVVPPAKVRVNEVMLQAQLEHLNIIKLLDLFECVLAKLADTCGVECTFEDGLCLVMELADHHRLKLSGPSLWDNIKNCVDINQRVKVYETESNFNRDGTERFCRPLKGGEATLRWVFLQVASALDFLHRHPSKLCNRDVKPHNVLVVDYAPHRDHIFRPVIKLADFGFCRATDIEPARSRLGTPAYAPPEILKMSQDSRAYDGTKADVWSAGVLLYVLAAGVEPFKHRDDINLTPAEANNAVMRRIAEGSYQIFTPERVGHCSPELQDLLKKMLDRDPSTRLTMLQVIQHPWSMKLNQDIQTRPGPEGEGDYLPAWTLLYENICQSVNGVSDKWTLPIPRAEVEALLTRVQSRT